MMEELQQDDIGQILWSFFHSVWEAARHPDTHPDYKDPTEGIFPGLAGEIRYDLLGSGDYLVVSLQHHLTADEIAAVSQYLDATRALPEDIFTKRGIGPGFGVLHPAWDGQRRRSIELFRKFEPRLRETWANLDWDPKWFDEFPRI
jgi:hypothetical protein